METYTCTSLDEIISAFRLTRNNWLAPTWFRGHPVEDWELSPSIWREVGKRPLAEMNMFDHFKSGAIGIRKDCPAYEDTLGWLMLMQHFGLPTRLLDWTQSLSVAGYFGVFDEEYRDEDGAIWILQPLLMSHYLGEQRPPSLAFVDNPHVLDLAERAKSGGALVERVLAISAPLQNERIIQQRGSFTIHGSPNPIEEVENSKKFLVKLVIPKEAKGEIVDSLGCLGVNRASLFPDVETLAEVISASVKLGIKRGYFGEEQ